jgi:hypothetical protein
MWYVSCREWITSGALLDDIPNVDWDENGATVSPRCYFMR